MWLCIVWGDKYQLYASCSNFVQILIGGKDFFILLFCLVLGLQSEFFLAILKLTPALCLYTCSVRLRGRGKNKNGLTLPFFIERPAHLLWHCFYEQCTKKATLTKKQLKPVCSYTLLWERLHFIFLWPAAQFRFSPLWGLYNVQPTRIDFVCSGVIACLTFRTES